MIITDAIKLLSSSEIKQLSLREDPDTILGYINFGILELHKRFLLWETEAVVTMVDGTLIYTLDGIDSNVSIDLSDNELMLIEGIKDEDDKDISVNQLKEAVTITTPKINQIKVPSDLDVQTLTVTYRAAPLFTASQSDVIPLPPQFLEALFIYVGYKASLSVKSGVKDENNTFYLRFEAECNKIRDNSLFTPHDLSSDNFYQRGFV